MLVALMAVAGCGGGDSGSPKSRAKERADAPAHPPPGWRTVRNRAAGFTISVPRGWTGRTRRAVTAIRSKDRLLALMVAADRGADGRTLAPADYARRTVDALPDFEGSVKPREHRVRGSPYRSARADGSGTLRTTKRAERIVVVAYQRPSLVTYALVAFYNPKLPARVAGPVLRRILRSLRAQPAAPRT